MYKLTPRMERHFRKSLKTYHDLFDGGRCQGWELEELIVNAIKSDTQAQHLPKWIEGGHDDKEDILLIENGKKTPLQIKSGKISGGRENRHLMLSGHRLGRFADDFSKISEYLNQRKAEIISVPYYQENSDRGRRHVYQICYIEAKMLKGVKGGDWKKHKAQYRAMNAHGVELSLRPSMSWQVWWKIPLDCIDMGRKFADGDFIES